MTVSRSALDLQERAINMSALVVPARPKAAAFQWHRPLMALAAAMVVCFAVCVVGLFVDSRTILGQPIWLKPLKFSLSIGIYAVTWAWLIQQLSAHRRVAWWAGTVSAFFLIVEQVIIVGAVVRGTTSHFNQTTPLASFLWKVMAGSIGVVWIATLVVSFILFRNPVRDGARNAAVRLGSVIAVVGMTLGILMTIPSKAQITAGGDIVGAHTVGSSDGGAGVPFLGWSTTGGDLRIPHFIGMHALQALPILLILLELAGRRLPRLSSSAVRARLVLVAGAGYLAVLALLTWQALRGQSIVNPDGTTVVLAAAIIAVIAAAVGLTLRRPADGSGATLRRMG